MVDQFAEDVKKTENITSFRISDILSDKFGTDNYDENGTDTDNNDKKDPLLWPAWVYCTR